MGKPFVLEEFGKNVSNVLNASAITMERDPTYNVIYGEYQNSLAAGNNLRGTAPCPCSLWNASPLHHVGSTYTNMCLNG